MRMPNFGFNENRKRMDNRMQDFDRSFKNIQNFIFVIFVAIILMLVLYVSTLGFVAYKVASDPGIVGKTVGTVINSYEKERNKK